MQQMLRSKPQDVLLSQPSVPYPVCQISLQWFRNGVQFSTPTKNMHHSLRLPLHLQHPGERNCNHTRQRSQQEIRTIHWTQQWDKKMNSNRNNTNDRGDKKMTIHRNLLTIDNTGWLHTPVYLPGLETFLPFSQTPSKDMKLYRTASRSHPCPFWQKLTLFYLKAGQMCVSIHRKFPGSTLTH